MSTLILSQEDVRKALSIEKVIDSVKAGYRAYQKGVLQQPDIQSMEMPANNGETDIKSCYNQDNEVVSVKIASGFYDNGKKNDLPSMIGVITLLDGKTGYPLCVMDGGLITNIRTGAAGAISCELFAREDAKIVCVLGGGGQAREQVRCLKKVRDIQEVRVFSEYPEELPAYKADIEGDPGIAVTICGSAEEAMEGTDIAISATPSRHYLADAALVRPGMHIVAVGADMAGKNEWDPALFAKADKVICDSIAQCVSRGETRNGILAGTITQEGIYAEIGEVLLGDRPGRESDSEITVFDTTGMGVQDNVTAAAVYETAKQEGMGIEFSFI